MQRHNTAAIRTGLRARPAACGYAAPSIITFAKCSDGAFAPEFTSSANGGLRVNPATPVWSSTTVSNSLQQGGSLHLVHRFIAFPES